MALSGPAARLPGARTSRGSGRSSNQDWVLLALSLCCWPQNCCPQLMPPISSGTTNLSPFRPTYMLPGEGDATNVVEMFYGETFYVCRKPWMAITIFASQPFEPSKKNCMERYHPFYLMRFPGRKGKSLIGLTEKYTVLSGETTDVVLQSNSIETIPGHYFCNLRNVVNLEIHGNRIESSESFGFSRQCAAANCSLNLKTLQLANNNLKVLVANSFCGFPNLEELDVSENAINSVHEAAFARLDNLRKLGMSSNSISTLPDGVFLLVKKLVVLDLSHNRLTEAVFGCLQSLPELKVLRLSWNVIKAIPNNLRLSSLTELHLDYNRIVKLDSPLGQLSGLVSLSLRSNSISHISATALVSLVNLTVLDLGYNALGNFSGGSIAANRKLVQLDVSFNGFSSVPVLEGMKTLILNNNHIRTITPEDGRIVCGMVGLEELHMEHNQLGSIAQGALDCGLNLTVLNFNANLLRSVRGVFANVTVERLILSLNEIEELWLDDIPHGVMEVDLSHNHIATLWSPLKQTLMSMSLVFLDLANNSITGLSGVHLPSTLERLSLKNNKLEVFNLGNFELAEDNSSAFTLENLKSIDLSYNRIQSFCPFILYVAASRTYPDVDLANNPLSCDCEIDFLTKYEDVIRPEELGLIVPHNETCPSWQQGSNKKTLSPFAGHGRFSCGASFKSFCECNLDGAYSRVCNFPCPDRCQCYLSSDYRSQLINCTAAGFDTLPTLPTRLPLELHFSNNSLRAITGSMLRSYSEATAMYLNDNRISSVSGGAFSGLPHLRILSLEANLLKSLPDGAFDGLYELTELYLAHNRLMHLTARVFQPMRAVRLIQLHDNSLSNFSVWTLSVPTLDRLSLRDNPWSCDCRYVEQFRNWLQNYSYVVEDAGKLFCTADNGTVQNSPLISFNSSQCYVLKDEVLVTNVAMWASVLASLALASLVCITAFVYRREMQVLVYYNYGVRLFYKNTEELDKDKLYDAFVAHSALDEEFLADELVPGLELIEQPYRLCIHQRDFLVGAVITESILEAVEKSRRTIVLLSENFVRSEWCRFEFKSAHLKTLADRCNRLIVIVLGKLPPDLDPEMKLYLKTNTYLEWGDRLFWQKLYFALPDRAPLV